MEVGKNIKTVVEEILKINTLVNNREFIKHRWEFVNKFLKDELNEMREKNIVVERDECYDELSNYLFRI